MRRNEVESRREADRCKRGLLEGGVLLLGLGPRIPEPAAAATADAKGAVVVRVLSTWGRHSLVVRQLVRRYVHLRREGAKEHGA